MNKPEESFDITDKDAQLNSTERNELLKSFDKKRRTFLKKLLISTAYVTPAILTLSMRDLEAKRKRPTRR
jgi:uncharacterized protein involved in tolerance to divalent cations